VEIHKELKKSRNLIDIPDLFIGATARANQLMLATLNEKHFSRIHGLELISKNE
jgi:tRNA(fMet)-specific endonuclease VapC